MCIGATTVALAIGSDLLMSPWGMGGEAGCRHVLGYNQKVLSRTSQIEATLPN